MEFDLTDIFDYGPSFKEPDDYCLIEGTRRHRRVVTPKISAREFRNYLFHNGWPDLERVVYFHRTKSGGLRITDQWRKDIF